MSILCSWKGRWVAAGVIVTVLLSAVPLPALADGIPLPPYGHVGDVEMPEQKAILIYDAAAQHEDLVISIRLLGESPDAAWVVPTPSVPHVATASAGWFSYLSDLTQPEIVTQTVFFGSCMATAPPGEAGGVEVLGRERVGLYDVSILAASDSGPLLDWLNDNGYVFPDEGQPVLDAYVAEGWTFVAVRVAPGETQTVKGDVEPLWLSFDAPAPVYPMRLTALAGNGVNVLLYVLSDHRMTADGMMTDFAGPLTLEPLASETGDLNALLGGQEFYVTKLRSWFGGMDMTEDVYPRRAESDTPYRRTVVRRVPSPLLECCSSLLPVAMLIGLFLLRGRGRPS
jgi:hypothetical protein